MINQLNKELANSKIENVKVWYKAGEVSEFEKDGGQCIKYEGMQIAVFNFNKTHWYACQNLCPHKLQMVLSRGMTGSEGDIPKIACPLHKKTFSLIDGSNLNGESYTINVYPVKIVDESVFVGLY